MSNAYEQLLSLVKPPAVPVNCGSHDQLEVIEGRLGMRLPTDFKLLIDTYGSGTWSEEFWILNPHSTEDALWWFDEQDLFLKSLREWPWTDPEDNPYPVWPEPNGLLIWGGQTNGGYMCWQTTGHPDQWPTVYALDRTPEYFQFEQPCTRFLLSLLTRTDRMVEHFDFLIRPGRMPFIPKNPS
ncbi:hypothetical protein ETAA8_67260 [Anatilimnocola aggregata]|uniref:SMI1/KNR4 family protein n=1 Tax=Anatilimnocola aggregata TaxID=2528021 RepID=A0A517YMX3_9BACT|nr:SMI1/KNR4 family protein [Anatilimnocola aggregata]QDU31567.1 hypothetical protein ETAA8_67260 [Anatilimnocola aggregata]